MPRSAVRRASAPSDPYAGLLDGAGAGGPLEVRRWFGCWAYYNGDRLVWVSADKREPWHGVLVPTEPAHHAALRREVTALRTHPVIRKWLYLPARAANFEADADRLVSLIAEGDSRVGVVTAVRRRRAHTRESRKERFG